MAARRRRSSLAVSRTADTRSDVSKTKPCAVDRRHEWNWTSPAVSRPNIGRPRKSEVVPRVTSEEYGLRARVARLASEMPFISKDWRSPGEEWVKTVEGWEKKKILECANNKTLSLLLRWVPQTASRIDFAFRYSSSPLAFPSSRPFLCFQITHADECDECWRAWRAHGRFREIRPPHSCYIDRTVLSLFTIASVRPAPDSFVRQRKGVSRSARNGTSDGSFDFGSR